MEPKTTEELGSCLVFPCVKELVAKNGELNSVPERYVSRNIDPFVLSNIDSLQHLPVIDLSKLLYEEVKGSELEKLDIACKEWGFFQVSFHISFPFFFYYK